MSLYITDIVFTVVIFVIMVCISDYGHKTEIVVFNRNDTGTLQGVAMVCIVFHHICGRVGIGANIINSIGFLATGVFFFISGYGNDKSVQSNGVNIEWILRKFRKIYIPFFIGYIVYYIVLLFAYPALLPNAKEVVYDLLTVSLPNAVSWFPKVVLVLFVLHYICAKLKLPVGYIIAALIIVYLAIMMRYNMSSYWYNSVLCYPFGIFMSDVEKHCQISKSAKMLVLSITLFTGAFILGIIIESPPILQILMAIFFAACCYYYTSIANINSKYLRWIGKNSFEFYIFHIFCLQCFAKLISINYFLYGGAVFLGSIIICAAYAKINNLLNRTFTKYEKTNHESD